MSKIITQAQFLTKNVFAHQLSLNLTFDKIAYSVQKKNIFKEHELFGENKTNRRFTTQKNAYGNYDIFHIREIREVMRE